MNLTPRLTDRYSVEMTHRTNGTKKDVIVRAMNAADCVRIAERDNPQWEVVGGIYHAKIHLHLG